MSKRPDCPFPGCTGGCHICSIVAKQRKDRPLYEAACRVLAQPGLDDDMRLLAEYVWERTKPLWDEVQKKWVKPEKPTPCQPLVNF